MKKPVKLAFGAVFLLFALIFFTLLTSRHAFFADPEEAATQTAIFMLEKRSSHSAVQNMGTIPLFLYLF